MYFYLPQTYLQETFTSLTEILGFQDEQFEQSFIAQRITIPLEFKVYKEPFWYREVNVAVQLAEQLKQKACNVLSCGVQ